MTTFWERAAHSVNHIFSLYAHFGFYCGTLVLMHYFLVIDYLLLFIEKRYGMYEKNTQENRQGYNKHENVSIHQIMFVVACKRFSIGRIHKRRCTRCNEYARVSGDYTK